MHQSKYVPQDNSDLLSAPENISRLIDALATLELRGLEFGYLTNLLGKKVRTLRGHAGDVAALAVNGDATILYSGSEDRTIKVWDLRAGRELRTLRGHMGDITSLALSGDGKRLFSGSMDRTVKIWDLELGIEVLSMRGHANGVTSLALTGQRAALHSVPLEVRQTATACAGPSKSKVHAKPFHPRRLIPRDPDERTIPQKSPH